MQIGHDEYQMPMEVNAPKETCKKLVLISVKWIDER